MCPFRWHWPPVGSLKFYDYRGHCRKWWLSGPQGQAWPLLKCFCCKIAGLDSAQLEGILIITLSLFFQPGGCGQSRGAETFHSEVILWPALVHWDYKRVPGHRNWGWKSWTVVSYSSLFQKGNICITSQKYLCGAIYWEKLIVNEDCHPFQSYFDFSHWKLLIPEFNWGVIVLNKVIWI